MGICLFLYFLQEKIIFYPQQLPKEYTFQFDQPFEELTIRTSDQVDLHGLLFKSPQPKGLIFYLHGNAGSLDSWGWVASDYTDLGYDAFFLDYRGFGKSEGVISCEDQFLSDIDLAYQYIANEYDEKQIVILGYSLGTGPAAYLASRYNPKQLILQAPYYSLLDMKNRTFPFVPNIALKYKLETNEYLKEVHAPVTIFHGLEDEVIYFGSGLKLKPLLKATDQLIGLKGQGHNDMSSNQEYKEEIGKLLK